jgi:ubiquinone/menaquinone biosynthesis C-methylase UbiE
VPAVSFDFIERLRDHLTARGVPPAMPHPSLPKQLVGLLDPRTLMSIRTRLISAETPSGEEISSRDARSVTRENTSDFVISDDAVQWMYMNRAERMDALDTSGIFSRDRQIFHRIRYEFAVGHVEGLEVADIACGLGYGCRILKQGGAKTVVGIDACPKAVQHARSNHGIDGVRFAVADATQIPLASSSVDVMISFETLEHIPDTTAVLAEFHRILRHKGRLIVSSPNDWGLTEHHCHSWTPFELQAEIAAFFEIESTWEQVSDSSRSESASPNGIRSWSKATEQAAECIIIIAQKIKTG